MRRAPFKEESQVKLLITNKTIIFIFQRETAQSKTGKFS
jgi:hypothetical protein